MTTNGFIVCSCYWGDPLGLVTESTSLWQDVPRAGILLRESRTAAVFPSRACARAAIRRTVAYFKRRRGDCPDPFEGFEIRRLIPTGGAA